MVSLSGNYGSRKMTDEAILQSLRAKLAELNQGFGQDLSPNDLSALCYVTGQYAAEIARIEKDLGIRQELTDIRSGKNVTGRLHRMVQARTISWRRGFIPYQIELWS